MLRKWSLANKSVCIYGGLWKSINFDFSLFLQYLSFSHTRPPIFHHKEVLRAVLFETFIFPYNFHVLQNYLKSIHLSTCSTCIQ